MRPGGKSSWSQCINSPSWHTWWWWHWWWWWWCPSSSLLFLCPLPSPPAELLFYVGVFITKSNVLLCQRQHPSPHAGQSLCVSMWVMNVWAPLMDFWQGHSAAQRHVQKSSCFIVCSRTELCFLQQQSLKAQSKTREETQSERGKSEYIKA